MLTVKFYVLFISLILINISIAFSYNISLSLKSFLMNKFEIISKQDFLLVHTIDVGEAECIAINFPNGEVALIDSGDVSTSYTVCEYLKNNVLVKDNINYLILTHTDTDHLGGSLRILDDFNVEYILLPKISDSVLNKINSKTYELFLESAKKEESQIFNYSAQDRIDFKDYCLQFYCTDKNYDNINNYCPAIKLEYEGTSFLFTGDMEYNAEIDLLNIYNEELNSDVLFVAHHGSNTSSSSEFLKSISPKYAVISVGENNYGHPSSAVIDRLKQCGVERTYTTENDGNILFFVSNNLSFRIFTGSNYLISNLALNYINYALIFEFILCLTICLSLSFEFKWYFKRFKKVMEQLITKNQK